MSSEEEAARSGGKVAFCFPGQGSLEAGMGREIAEAIPEAMAVYERGSESCGLDLRALCFTSPVEDMVDTSIQQPALLATSLAILAAVESLGFRPDYVVGHSVGEFAALAAGRVFETADAIGARGGQGDAAGGRHIGCDDDGPVRSHGIENCDSIGGELIGVLQSRGRPPVGHPGVPGIQPDEPTHRGEAALEPSERRVVVHGGDRDPQSAPLKEVDRTFAQNLVSDVHSAGVSESDPRARCHLERLLGAPLKTRPPPMLRDHRDRAAPNMGEA